MKYLHVVPRNYEVMREIVRFFRKYFDADEHYILFHTSCTSKYAEILNTKNVFDWREMGTGKWGKYQGYKKFLEEADIVFLHGFYFRNSLLEFYYTHRNLLKKCVWIGWGIDIYNWKRPEVNIKNRLLNHMDVVCRKNLFGSGVLLGTDTPVLKENFGDTSKTYITPYPYQAHNFDLMDELRRQPKNHDGIHIQLGNNSFKFNHQVEILDALRPFRNENIKIMMPLTYGNAGHIETPGHTQRLCRYAKEIFGDKVVIQQKSLKKDYYTKLLASHDIGIFNAHRQNALGNILRLSYMGKKIYLHSDNPLYQFVKDKGVEIYDVKDIPKMTFEEFSAPPKAKEPAPWIREYYHPDMAARYWAAMFREVDARMYHNGDLSKCPEIPGFEGWRLNGSELVFDPDWDKK